MMQLPACNSRQSPITLDEGRLGLHIGSYGIINIAIPGAAAKIDNYHSGGARLVEARGGLEGTKKHESIGVATGVEVSDDITHARLAIGTEVKRIGTGAA